jgi:hypothetical protein
LSVLQSAFSHPTRSPHFSVTLGPCAGDDALPCPATVDFILGEYERVPFDQITPLSALRTSSYQIRKGLSRKAQLHHYTSLYIAKNPSTALKQAMPESVIIETWAAFEEDSVVTLGDGQKLTLGDNIQMTAVDKLKECAAAAYQMMDLDEVAGRQETYILKPSTSNKGEGIILVYCFEQVVAHLEENCDDREWVLQRYLANPMLLGGRKFHIRAYVLCVGAIKVFFYKHVLFLCSGTKYDVNDTSLFGHVTNTCYQALDDGFVEEECVLGWDDFDRIKREEGRSEEEVGAMRKDLLEQMKEITGELFKAYKSFSNVFEPLSGSFEHYGIDFLVTSSNSVNSVKLLEVNPGPDYKQSGSRCRYIVEGMLTESVDVGLTEGNTDGKGRGFECVYEEEW